MRRVFHVRGYLKNWLTWTLTIYLVFVNRLHSQTEPDYFPMHIGNEWTYEYHWEDRNQNTIDSMLTLSIIDSYLTYYRFDHFFLYYSTFGGDSSLLKMDSGKVIRKVNSKDMIWYDFSAAVGDSWIIPVNDHKLFPIDTLYIVAELKSKTDTFILGEDTLKNCYRFQFRFTRSIPDLSPWEELFAPNIGLVEKTAGWMHWNQEFYKLKKAIINNGNVSVVDRKDKNPDVPKVFFLAQNHPNPFYSNTRISYRLIGRSGAKVSLRIYNILGQEIKTLINQHQSLGFQNVLWNGRDKVGREVPAGIYWYVLTVDDYREIKKMVLVKPDK